MTKTLAELKEIRKNVHELYVEALAAHKIARAAERAYFEEIKKYTRSLPTIVSEKEETKCQR